MGKCQIDQREIATSDYPLVSLAMACTSHIFLVQHVFLLVLMIIKSVVSRGKAGRRASLSDRTNDQTGQADGVNVRV